MRFSGIPKREKRQLALKGDHAQSKETLVLVSGANQSSSLLAITGKNQPAGTPVVSIGGDQAGDLLAMSMTTANQTNCLSFTTDWPGGGTSKRIISYGGNFSVDLNGNLATVAISSVGNITSTGGAIISFPIYNPSFQMVIDNTAHSTANESNIQMATGTMSHSSGDNTVVVIKPTYSQSGTAGSTDLKINRTESSIGSGVQLLIDAQVGSKSFFRVSNTGIITIAGASSTSARDKANLTPVAVDNTDATRKYRLVFNVFDTASREAMRIEADGSNPMIGFLGASAVTRQTVSGSRGANAALASLLTALANLGLITDSSS